jgi:hypothetical protein
MRYLTSLLIASLFGWVTPCLAQPLTFIEGRTFESSYGFLIAIPPGTTACRGGWTDHGFFLFLGSKAPCIRADALADDKVPWVVQSAPEESIPYIQFWYSWNAAFSPESAWEAVEESCQNEKYPERNEEAYGSRIGVSSFRFLGHIGIECVRRYRPTDRVSVLIRFHPFALGNPGDLDTDDDGYIVPYAHYTVSMVTTTRDYRKHREMLRRVFDAIARPSKEPKS